MYYCVSLGRHDKRYRVAMTKFFIILLLCIQSTAALSNSITQPLVGSHNEWPPYIFADGTGMTTELVRAAFFSQNIAFDTKIAPFSRAMRMLENNEIDLIPALWWTENRAKTILFSQPYFTNELSIISNTKSQLDYQGPHSLESLTISTIRGYGYHEYLQSIDRLTIVPLLNVHSCLEHVKKHRADIALVDKYAAWFEMKKNGYSTELTIWQPALIKHPLHIGISKEHPDAEYIITSFNKGLEQIKRSGEYDEILARYEHLASAQPE